MVKTYVFVILLLLSIVSPQMAYAEGWTDSGTNVHLTTSGDNVGIGTSTPTQKLDVSGNIQAQRFIGVKDESNPYFELNKTGGTARVWYFQVGATTTNADDLSVNLQGNPAQFLIKTNGNIGIGTTAPGQKLDISGGNGRVQSGYNWLTDSDIRYKTNVTTLTDVGKKIRNLRGVRYDLKKDQDIVPENGKQIGFIAQELEKEYPELVYTDENGLKSVAYDKMTAVLLQAIKEQQNQINDLKEEINKLKN